jgi:hypothetical protein
MHHYWWGLVIAHMVILLHARLCAEILWTEVHIHYNLPITCTNYLIEAAIWYLEDQGNG